MAENTLNIQIKNSYSVIYPSDFENCLKTAYESLKGKSIKNAIVDMTEILFVDIATLLNISATLNKLIIDNPKIILLIKLPKSFPVVKFLCTWNFKEAIEKVTQKDFYELLSNSDSLVYEKAIYFARENELAAKDRVSDSLETLTYKKFFSIYSFDITDYYLKRQLILDFSQGKTDEWKKEDIKNILNRYIRDVSEQPSNGYIGNNIFFECLTNALRHPQGTILQTTSKFTKRKRVLKFLSSNRKSIDETKIKASDNFSLVFWDNGKNMIKSLKTVAESGINIRTSYKPFHFPVFRVNYKDEFNPELSNIFIPISSSKTPTLKDEEYFWLLSTFFPGITRDVIGETHVKGNPSNSNGSKLDFEQPGMGLCCLLDTAVKAFNGEIVVRTDKYRMVIKKASRKIYKGYKFDYLVSIKKKASIPDFNGNLFAVHIPVYKNYEE